MSIEALVTRIKTYPIPGMDRIQQGICSGFTVIVSKDIKNGDLGIFIPPEAQLSQAFCYENSLYREKEGKNKRPDASGYLDSNRRVKQIKMKGILSEGLWLPIDCLSYLSTDLSGLKEGTTLTEVGTIEFISRYITPAQFEGQKNKDKTPRVRSSTMPMFKEHKDTANLRYTMHSIPEEATLILTLKMHGTSGRTGHVLRNIPLTSWQKKWNDWFGKWIRFTEPQEWVTVSGTRKTVLSQGEVDGWYKSNFRQQIHDQIAPQLHKGETIYYEIVGWTAPTGSPVQKGINLADDPIRKQLSKDLKTNYMHWAYGCKPGETGIYIYRITHTDIDNNTTELSWAQIQARANELGIPAVPTIKTITYRVEEREELLSYLKDYCSKPDPLFPDQVVEGICVRIESPIRFGTILKYKGDLFSYLEGRLRDLPDFVDVEEIS